MRALQMVGYQRDPELREVADPEPGPGQVVLRVGGAGACHSDLHLLYEFPDGLLPWPLPFTLGHEVAGWVDALGPGVTGLEVGQPVALYGPWGCGRCSRCRVGAENLWESGLSTGGAGPAPGEPVPAPAAGLGADGGMAERVLVPDARRLLPLGDLDPVTAAPLTDAGLTPYHAVVRALPGLRPGSHAVVIGVGGLGHLAVQLLEVLTAATVIAVDVRDDALALAADAGAAHTIRLDPRPEDGPPGVDPGAVAAIRDATGGQGADLVLDVVGTDDTLALAAAVTRSLGQVSLLGIAGGTFPFGYFTTAHEVSFATTYWGTIGELGEVLALAAKGHLRPHIERFALADAVEAYRRLHAGEVAGRAVVVP